jgi:histidyl-tRNA synthetase
VSGAGAIDLYVAFKDLNGGAQGGVPTGAPPAAGRSAARAAFKLLHQARGAGLDAQMELAGRSLKNQLSHAERLGARYVAIVGGPHRDADDARGAGGEAVGEDARETVLKDVQARTQQAIPTDTVVHAVLRGLRDI